MSSIHTIATYSKPQPDTVAAIFLLRKYGEAQFPGVSTAQITLWNDLPAGRRAEELEAEGYLLVDLGQGRFDHHRQLENGRPVRCAAELVAEQLGVQGDPSLKKLLAYARRDDLEGKGTISSDPIDRAFGLSGLLSNLNRAYAHDLVGVINMVLAIFEAHHQEEENRTKLMPAEWKQLCQSGAASQWGVSSSAGWLRVVQVPTDNPGMAGFLKAYHRFDLVVARRSSGHVNIISNQAKPIDLSTVAARLRQAELAKSNQQHPALDLHRPGRLEEVPHWYYDTAANTLQNGGLYPEGVPPTQLSDQEIKLAIQAGLQIAEQSAVTKPAAKKGIIWAAVLPEELPALKAQIPKLYEKSFHLHVTLAYAVEQQDDSVPQTRLIGQRSQVLVTGYAHNGLIQAALVDLSQSGLTSTNQVPHISISAQPGVPPASSNDMLAGQHEEVRLERPISIRVRVEFCEFK